VPPARFQRATFRYSEVRLDVWTQVAVRDLVPRTSEPIISAPPTSLFYHYLAQAWAGSVRPFDTLQQLCFEPGVVGLESFYDLSHVQPLLRSPLLSTSE
jgi:hypothetical protein